MTYLYPVLMALLVVSALSIIGLVLLQQGKGADMGSAFGGGSAGSLFGAAGSANFFSRLTKWAAIVFFATTLGLAYISTDRPQAPAADADSVLDKMSDDVPAMPHLPSTLESYPDQSPPPAPAPAAQQ